jgi:hypothetical protein
MKQLIIIFLLIAGALAVSAQEEITVTLQERPSSKGLQPAFEVEIPQAKENDAINILQKTLAPRGLFRIFSKNPRLVQVKDEWIMRDVEVNKISIKPLNVYAQVSSFPERIFVKIFFQEEDQEFIGSSESKSAKTEDASRFVREYGVEVYRNAVEAELRIEQDILSSLEQDLRKMGRKNSSTDRKISNMKSDNADMRNEIREYEMRMERKQTFNAQGEGATIILDQNEVDAKQLRKDIRSNQSKINRNERRISKFERQGNRNLRDQGDLMNQIDRQKIVVNVVETKLSKIK